MNELALSVEKVAIFQRSAITGSASRPKKMITTRKGGSMEVIVVVVSSSDTRRVRNPIRIGRMQKMMIAKWEHTEKLFICLVR